MLDELPPDVIYNEYLECNAGGCEWQPSQNAISWTGAIGVGSPVTITYQVKVKADMSEGTLIENTAWIDYEEGSFDTPATMTMVGLYRAYLPLIMRNYRADTYEPNDSHQQAYGPLVSGTTYRSYIWAPDDDDWYYIEVSALDTITIDLNVPPVADYDLYLYDSTGTNIVAKSDSFGNGVDEHIEYQPDQTGRYYIRVYPYQGYSDSDPYSLVGTFH